MRVFLIVVGLFWLVPTIGVLLSSLRTPEAIGADGGWHVFSKPSELTFASYADLLENGGHHRLPGQHRADRGPGDGPRRRDRLTGRIRVAWMEFPGRDWWFLGVVGLLVVPAEVGLIPQPRTDAFQRATPADVARLRELFGVPEGTVAILYGPPPATTGAPSARS
ncbi:hypothetical protein SFUMM280S_07184 [Streptomyces fumanus]